MSKLNKMQEKVKKSKKKNNKKTNQGCSVNSKWKGQRENKKYRGQGK